MAENFDTGVKLNWCPGCGNFGLFTAVKNAFVKLKIQPKDILFVCGIGCHGHMINFLNACGFQGLHGRPIPVAVGAKLANKNLHVVVFTGDGDCLGEGLTHFINAARGNHDITVIIHDNQLYSLTTGQASPTSLKGHKTKSTPKGVVETPINPLTTALTANASFVARGSAATHIPHLTDLFVEAIQHKGFSVVDVFQPCVTFNKLNTYQWFKERVYVLENHDIKNKQLAYEKALEEEKLPIGIFYKEERSVYQGRKEDLIKQSVNNIDNLMNELR